MRRPDPTQRFLTGQGRYLSDLCDEDTLHCWFVRSPIAHGIITEIDVESASALPGVVGVYVAEDLDLPDLPGNTGRGPEAPEMTRPPLARDRVRYVGDAVAVVVAEDRAVAEDAAGLAWVEYEELPAVVDPVEAAEDRVLLFSDAGSNIVGVSTLEGDAGSEETCEISTTVELENQRLAPNPLEPLGIMAKPVGDQIHVACGHQAPHRLLHQLEGLGEFDPGSIRVIAPDVGGAFGMKGMLFPEYFVVPRLAQLLGAPVAWTATRRENMLIGTHGRAQRHRITLEGTASGEILRAKIDLLLDVGAYPHNGAQLPLFTRLTSAGLYRIPDIEMTFTVVVTNTAPVGSYRGAGRPEAAYAIERAIDEFAHRAGLDPVEVRRRNLIPGGDLPYRTPTGVLYDSGNYHAALERALELADIAALREEQRMRLESGLDPIGVGVAAFVERAGGAADSAEYAMVEVEADPDRVVVRTGSTDQGQGHDRVWGDLLRKLFQVEEILVISGDTGEVEAGVGTYASRSAQVGASAAFRMANRVLEEARNRAADRLEASPADMVYEKGVFSVVGSPGTDISIFDLAAEKPLAADEMYSPGAQTFPYGAYVAVVEVELETGEVRPLEIIAVDDCGTVLDDAIVEGQLHGSLAQGLGQALFEKVHYSEDGQLMTASLLDYLLPHAPDVPPIVSDRLVHPAPSNPLGVKGSGEAGCIGLPPAIVNATLDALRPFGVFDLGMPLTPSRVWTALKDARLSDGDRS